MIEQKSEESVSSEIVSDSDVAIHNKARATEEMINKYILKAKERELSNQISKKELNLVRREVDTRNDVLIPSEKDWLENNQSNNKYDEIKQRVMVAKHYSVELQSESNTAHQYFENEMTKSMLKQNTVYTHQSEDRDRLITIISFQLLDEVMLLSISELCVDLMAASQSSLDLLNRSFIRALTNFSDSNKRFLKMSGRIDVLKGALMDVETADVTGGGYSLPVNLNPNNDNKPKVMMTQRMMIIPNKYTNVSAPSSTTKDNAPDNVTIFPNPLTVEKTPNSWRPHVHSTLPLMPPLYCDDTLFAATLHQQETVHVNGVSLQDSASCPLQLPPGSGRISVLHCALHVEAKRSVLIVGTTKGRVCIFDVPWNGSAPSLLAVTSSAFNKTSESNGPLSDITEIKISPQGVNMFTTLNRAGNVSVFHTNLSPSDTDLTKQQAATGGSTLSKVYNYFFGSKQRQAKPLELNCVFSLNKFDLTLSLPIVKSAPDPYANTHNTNTDIIVNANGTVQTTKQSTLSSLLSSNAIEMEQSVFPVTVCFHPSTSALGHCTSVVIGTVGGDMVKFNMDYHLKATQAKITFPTNSHVRPLPSTAANIVHEQVISTGAVNSKGLSISPRSTARTPLKRAGTNSSTVNNSPRPQPPVATQPIKTAVSAAVESPLPFVNKEYIHNHDAPLGFVLTSGNITNKGNTVYRELYHYHKSRILYVDMLNGLSDCLVSLDAKGYFAVWKYSSDYFTGKFWFTPQTAIKLDLAVRVFDTAEEVTHKTNELDVRSADHAVDAFSSEEPANGAVTDHSGGGSPRKESYRNSMAERRNNHNSEHDSQHHSSHPSPHHHSKGSPILPSEDELLQLVCRSRRVHVKSGVVTEVFYPVFSQTENHLIQYRRRTRPAVLPIQAAEREVERQQKKMKRDLAKKQAKAEAVKATEVLPQLVTTHAHSQEIAAISQPVVPPEMDVSPSNPSPPELTSLNANESTPSDITPGPQSEIIPPSAINVTATPTSTSKPPSRFKAWSSAVNSTVPATVSAPVETPLPPVAVSSPPEPAINESESKVIMEAPVQLLTPLPDTETKTSSIEADVPPAIDRDLGLSKDSNASDHAASSVVLPPAVTWSYAKVRQRDRRLVIQGTRLSQDGTDLVLLLSSDGGNAKSDNSERKPNNPVKSNKSDGKTSSTSVTTSTFYIVTLHTVTLQFHSLYPAMTLDNKTDAVLDFCPGPIMSETLSRLCFVLTKRDGLRLFSLETGFEFRSSSFPFKPALASFTPTRIALCPSQRVLSLYSPEDARIAVYVIKHSQDGSTISLDTTSGFPENSPSDLKSNDIDASKRTYAYLRGLSRATVLDITVLPRVVLTAAQVDMLELVEEVVEGVFRRLDISIQNKNKSDLIASLYGQSDGLGFIAPTSWPVPEVEPVFQYEQQSPPVATVPVADNPVEDVTERAPPESSGDDLNEKEKAVVESKSTDAASESLSDAFVQQAVSAALESVIGRMLSEPSAVTTIAAQPTELPLTDQSSPLEVASIPQPASFVNPSPLQVSGVDSVAVPTETPQPSPAAVTGTPKVMSEAELEAWAASMLND